MKKTCTQKDIRSRITGKRAAAILTLLLCLLMTGCISQEQTGGEAKTVGQAAEITAEDYNGEPYVEINDNEPEFTEEELQTQSYEEYSDLDALGRCGTAQACIGTDLMPTEKRGSIGQVKPTGWHLVKYDNVDGKYLYNRCHLIGYQLTGENANEKNLITGTRYMNVEGMLPFEDMVADYVEETDNHVLYRVTPVYQGDNPLATGVQMEAQSVEDGGQGISYNVFVYNVQPDITIDYTTGESRESEDSPKSLSEKEQNTQGSTAGSDMTMTSDTYVININTGKFHDPACSSVDDMKRQNRKDYTGTRSRLIEQGYEPCGRCRP